MKQDQNEFHLILMGLAVAHKKYCMGQFNELNLTTGQPKVLAVLLQREGYLQKDLAKRCGVEPATMTSILKNMELKGLIRKNRESVSGGKKAYSIYLTEIGRKRAEQIQEIVKSAESIAFLNMDESEKELLLSMMIKVEKNLTHMMLEERNRYEE